MTNIEQEFFEAFGIKNKVYCKCTSDYCVSADKPYPSMCKKCPYYSTYKIDFPPITDKALLMLICILARLKMNEREFYKIKTSNTKILKSYILEDCIDNIRYLNEIEKQDFIKQVRALFEEEE